MAVVLDTRDSSRRAPRVDATATPAAANAPRDHGSRQTKSTTSSSPRTPRARRGTRSRLPSRLAQPNRASVREGGRAGA
jgi:hypothetical protein